MLYTDYNVAVVYECQSVGSDNRCNADQEFLDVLNRDAHGFTQDNLHELKEHLNAACIQEDDMQLSSHHSMFLILAVNVLVILSIGNKYQYVLPSENAPNTC